MQAASSTGRSGGGPLAWLQAGKWFSSLGLSNLLSLPHPEQQEAAAPAAQQAVHVLVQGEEEQDSTRVASSPATATATANPPRVSTHLGMQPLQPFQHLSHATMHTNVSGTAHAIGTAVHSKGPLRASDMLAGVPLHEMQERRQAAQQAAQQLQRQQQQLGGGGSGEGSVAFPASSSSGATSSSARNSSLWGSTAGQAAPATTVAPPPSRAAPSQDSASLRAELSPVTSPEAAVAFAAYERVVAGRRMVPVSLSLHLQAAEGQRLKVVGGHSNLGKWSLDAAPELQRSEGDSWQVTVQLPAGSVTEYKYSLLDSSGRVVALQGGNNGVLAVGFGDERLEVQDSWEGDAAGVSVIVDGQQGAWPATRESRLVAWANDLFQQVASLRQDLRSSRMELVGAREEAHAAQAEAARLLCEVEGMRGAMAELAAERQVDRAELAQSQAVNQVLQAQLADTTASLYEAIETASELLAGQEYDDGEASDSGAAVSS